MEIEERCNKIEECYEFMLAYAAQGLPSDQGSHSGGQIRVFLNRAVNALDGLAKSYAIAVRNEGLEPAGKYHASSTCSTATPRTHSRRWNSFWRSPRSTRS